MDRMNFARGSKPRPLVIVRCIVFVILLILLIVFSVVQLLKTISPSITYQLEQHHANIALPTIVLQLSIPYQLVDPIISWQAVYRNERGPVNASPIPVTNIRKNLVNGTDLLNAGAGGSAYRFTPPEEIYFRQGSGDNNQTIYQLRLLVKLGEIDANFFNQSLGESRNVMTTELPGLNAYMLPPVDEFAQIDLASDDVLYAGYIEYQHLLQVRFREEHIIRSNGQQISKYTSKTSSSPLPPAVAEFVVAFTPTNMLTENLTDFIIPSRTERYGFTWLDLISSIGGAMFLGSVIYVFLLGSRRLKPWGILQKYVFRAAYLDASSTPVVSMKDKSPVNRSSKSAKTATITPAQMFPLSTRQSSSDHQLTELSDRLADLEAFQQRLNLYYLNHDLFTNKDPKTPVPASDASEKDPSSTPMGENEPWASQTLVLPQSSSGPQNSPTGLSPPSWPALHPPRSPARSVIVEVVPDVGTK